MNKKLVIILVVVLLIFSLIGIVLFFHFFKSKSRAGVDTVTEVAAPREEAPAKRDLLEVSSDKPFPFKSFEITIKSIQYSAGRVPGYENLADQTQKLVVVTFQARNKDANPAGIGYVAPWTVVDDTGKRANVETVVDNASHKYVEGDLEPNASREVSAVFLLDGQAKVASFFLDPNDGAPQTRVKLAAPPLPLDPVFSDAKDTTGATVLARIPARLEQVYPLSYPYDFAVNGMALSATGTNQAAAGEGKQFLVVSLTLTNATDKVQNANYGAIQFKVKDVDGGVVEGSGLVKASSDDDLSVEVDPGASVKARAFIEVPVKPALASLIVQEPRGSGEARAFTYDLKGLVPAPAPAAAPANP